MQVNDQLINQMLRNLPQDQQDVMAGILRQEYAFEVVCNSQDVFADVEVPVLDEDGNQVAYKSGKHKGEPKFTTEKQLIQEGAKGRTIAYITVNGEVVPTKDEQGRMWLRSSRRRTDGEWGFQSWCSTDSILAEHEIGVIGEAQPSKEDIAQLAQNLAEKPPKYVTINGEREVDGFIIRDVKN